jgi:hypothetical protein
MHADSPCCNLAASHSPPHAHVLGLHLIHLLINQTTGHAMCTHARSASPSTQNRSFDKINSNRMHIATTQSADHFLGRRRRWVSTHRQLSIIQSIYYLVCTVGQPRLQCLPATIYTFFSAYCRQAKVHSWLWNWRRRTVLAKVSVSRFISSGISEFVHVVAVKHSSFGLAWAPLHGIKSGYIYPCNYNTAQSTFYQLERMTRCCGLKASSSTEPLTCPVHYSQ